MHFRFDHDQLFLTTSQPRLTAALMQRMHIHPKAMFFAARIAFLLAIMIPMQLSADSQDDRIESVTVGINSQAKLGKWLPVSITTQGLTVEPVSYVITAFDSNATLVDYTGTLTRLGDRKYQALARLGRQHGNIDISLLDADGIELCNKRIAVSSATQVQPSTANHVMLIGSDERLTASCDAAMDALLGETPYAVITTKSASEVPANWLGYDGINTVFLSTSNASQLESLTPVQWNALETWVERGGRLILSVNGAEGRLQPGGLLSRFLVGSYKDTIMLEAMGKLDNYSRIRLEAEELAVAELEVNDGLIVLAQESLPLVVRQVKGLGQIVFVTFDISDPALNDWDGTTPTVMRLLKAGELDEIIANKDSVRKPATSVGFTDLAGQLRIPLEQFSKVQLINFTVVAVLIGLYILCVGPGDFFLLKKYAKKMELTWVSFTIFTIAFCGIAYLLSGWSRPAEMQINQLEIIDIDASTNSVRGNAWSNIFSPKTGQHEVNFDFGNAANIEGKDYLVSWFGTPGDGIGGMQSKAGLSVSQSHYRIDIADNNAGNTITTIGQLPLQVSSTRSLHTEWNGKLDAKIESNLEFTDSQLIGQITNPFPFELKNVRVMYGNYTYVLSNTLGAGLTIDLASETRERDSKSYMTRRTKSADKKDRGQNMPWDPASNRIDRIADMMMFYETAGGIDYTSLTHGFQNRIEMSEQIAYDRAIFIGEVDTKTCQITIDGKTLDENYDNQLTVFRILLPVD